MDAATTPAFLIIGIVDSGIWPESKSFSDRTGVGPNGQQGKLAYQQIPGWHGKCASGGDGGEAFNASMCNQKLIGAQFFCEAKGCDTVLPHEFLSPRDYNGHGTHTASTAGGNEGVATSGSSATRWMQTAIPCSTRKGDGEDRRLRARWSSAEQCARRQEPGGEERRRRRRRDVFDEETDGADDIDLYLYRVNADSSLTLVALSAGGSAAEQVQLVNPAPATYRLFVHGWQTDGPDANYSLHVWGLGTADEGNMTVTGPASATLGGTAALNLSWTGLAAGQKYLGAIDYNEGPTTHATTIVRIDN